MDYEIKYKKALENARQFSEHPLLEDSSCIVEYIFPELKESEDERIRKALIDYFDDANKIDENPLQGYDIHTDKVIAWLEKQCKQKPSDKAEPKFKIGDWIIHYGTENIYQVVSIIDNQYQLKYGDNYTVQKCADVDRCARLYDVSKDAKKGDVLSDGTTIFIFKDLLSDGSVMSYCDYDTDSSESDAFCPSSVNLMCSKITLATKEQCDLLFQNMKEAGYEWDAEKKKVMRIDNEEINGEDYGIDGLYHAQRILEKTLGKVDGYQTDDGILDHKAAITVVKNLYNHKSAWNKEDELMKLSIEQVTTCASFLNIVPEKMNKIKTWLKQLKYRIGG